MSVSRNKIQFSLFQKGQGYRIEECSSNEFIVTIKHLTFIYEKEFSHFLENKVSNIMFSVHGLNCVQLHIIASNENTFQNTHKQFQIIMQFLNNNKLETRDYAEIIQKYECFLKKNNLNAYMNHANKHGFDDRFRGNNNLAF